MPPRRGKRESTARDAWPFTGRHALRRMSEPRERFLENRFNFYIRVQRTLTRKNEKLFKLTVCVKITDALTGSGSSWRRRSSEIHGWRATAAAAKRQWSRRGPPPEPVAGGTGRRGTVECQAPFTRARALCWQYGSADRHRQQLTVWWRRRLPLPR